EHRRIVAAAAAATRRNASWVALALALTDDRVDLAAQGLHGLRPGTLRDDLALLHGLRAHPGHLSDVAVSGPDLLSRGRERLALDVRHDTGRRRLLLLVEGRGDGLRRVHRDRTGTLPFAGAAPARERSAASGRRSQGHRRPLVEVGRAGCA